MQILVGEFERPNLRYSVLRQTKTLPKAIDANQKANPYKLGCLPVVYDILRIAARHRIGLEAGAGIVYVSTKNAADLLADALSSVGLQCAGYHAGLKAKER